MPENSLPRLFERVYRVDDARSSNGLGLGLALVRAIIDLHHGQVSAEASRPGLRITVSLPLAV